MLPRCCQLILLGSLSLLGCNSVDADDPGASSSALEGDPERGFQPKLRCVDQNTGNDYIGEVDFSDREHPRYRIRHNNSFASYEIGRQNIHLMFNDGTYWNSPDTLVSHFNGARTGTDGEKMRSESVSPERQAEADATDPWNELGLPRDVLRKAFFVENGRYNLLTARFIFNFANRRDFPYHCDASFYGAEAHDPPR